MVAYNFKDLQFCEDFDKSTDADVKYKWAGMRQGMSGSECNQCPSNLVGKCKCYNQADKGTDPVPGTINEVFCAQEIDGFRYACPEKCCGTSGCTEPRRSDPNSVETTVVGPSQTVGSSGTTSPSETTAPPAEGFAIWKIALIIGGILLLLGIIAFFVFMKK